MTAPSPQEQRVEWGVRYSDRVVESHDLDSDYQQRRDEEDARRVAEVIPGTTLVRRVVTVGPWEEVTP